MKAQSNAVSRLRIAVVLLIALSTTACGVLRGKRPHQAVHQYSLNAGLKPGASEFKAEGGKSCISAQVLVPKSASGFNTVRMAYQRAPDQLEYFAFNRWVDRPANMLQPLLMKALAESGRFEHVVMVPSTVGSRFRLEADELALVQQFDGGVNTVRLALRLRLVDTADGKFLFDEVIALERAAAQADPVAGVATANALARDLMQRTTEAAQAAVDLSVLCGG